VDSTLTALKLKMIEWFAPMESTPVILLLKEKTNVSLVLLGTFAIVVLVLMHQKLAPRLSKSVKLENSVLQNHMLWPHLL
jgi:hypothetical protein